MISAINNKDTKKARNITATDSYCLIESIVTNRVIDKVWKVRDNIAQLIVGTEMRLQW